MNIRRIMISKQDFLVVMHKSRKTVLGSCKLFYTNNKLFWAALISVLSTVTNRFHNSSELVWPELQIVLTTVWDMQRRKRSLCFIRYQDRTPEGIIQNLCPWTFRFFKFFDPPPHHLPRLGHFIARKNVHCVINVHKLMSTRISSFSTEIWE